MRNAAETVSWNEQGNELTLRFKANQAPRPSESQQQRSAAASSREVPPAVGASRERWQARLSRLNTVAWRDLLRSAGPVVRRAVDVSAGVVGLIVTAPLVAAAACAVKATSPGPAFYGQMRAGQFGRPFKLFKVRSMYLDAAERLANLQHLNESVGAVTFKIRRDPRVTPVGRILRKFSIDELPQLWNLVNGTMTLIGPRPLVLYETAKLEPQARRRLEVKPGITCLWQVSGRSDLSFSEQVALDLKYIDTTTAVDEARILAVTFPVVVTGRGAY